MFRESTGISEYHCFRTSRSNHPMAAMIRREIPGRYWTTCRPSTLLLPPYATARHPRSQSKSRFLKPKLDPAMPFHLHSSSQHNAQQMPPGAASGILQAAQLGSIGAPTGNLSQATANKATVGIERSPPLGGNMSTGHPGGQSAPPSTHGLPQPNSSVTSPSTGPINQAHQFEIPRRRHPDELHLTSVPTNLAAQRGALSPRDYTPAGPRISLEQVTPDTSQFQSTGQLPGSLQPGRPPPMSANTAPAVPTIPPTMSQDSYATPSRSSTLNPSHNYTRSSPAGFDGQGYPPFTATTPGGTDQGQFASPTQKYTPQNPQRAVSNTPLGLADIRPRADSGLSDGLPGSNPYSYDGANAVPTNSNYLAPWAIYAFDWCKWPAQSQDAGKVAVGSYFEDGHNFLRPLKLYPISSPVIHANLLVFSDPNTGFTNHTHSARIIHTRCPEVWVGICEDCRSNSLLSCDSPVMGATILAEAID